MKATEGNGGPPIVLSREPVEKPEIVRGPYWFRENGHEHEFHSDGTVTFTVDGSDFDITYHRTHHNRDAEGYVFVTIAPDTVVTWVRL